MLPRRQVLVESSDAGSLSFLSLSLSLSLCLPPPPVRASVRVPPCDAWREPRREPRCDPRRDARREPDEIDGGTFRLPAGGCQVATLMETLTHGHPVAATSLLVLLVLLVLLLSIYISFHFGVFFFFLRAGKVEEMKWTISFPATEPAQWQFRRSD